MLRLTAWYAAVLTLVLAAFAFTVYEIVEHRLAAEIDRQLRIDFDLVEGQLEADALGKLRWSLQGAHGDEGFVRLFAWFEVWGEDGNLLLRHWPVRDADIERPLPRPIAATLRFHSVEVEPGLTVRLMERPARIGGRGVVVRIFKDESDMRQTLGQIVEVFFFALPFAIGLASFGGYFLAKRSLSPVTAMASRAREITSESLASRLPVDNPHDEFGQLASVFNQTLARLQSSFEELKTFTADASHELRTPLTALRAVGEVALQRGEDPAQLREAILSMLEEAERLTALTESLLALARLETHGAVEAALTELELADAMQETADTVAVLLEQKQQKLDLEMAPGLRVVGEPSQLRLILLNILHNAIRYSPPGSRILMRSSSMGSVAALDIIDEGPGIAPIDQEAVFRRFFRVDAARSRAAGGHGLGLAIARVAVSRLGGRIELESVVGQGSRFRICLNKASGSAE
jgi:heavy metal sensor kinase